MAGKFSSSAVISYFVGDDSDHLAEVVFEGSEDELGMEDEDDNVSEPEFEPLEVSDEGKLANMHHRHCPNTLLARTKNNID